jgi:hypothetical protein
MKSIRDLPLCMVLAVSLIAGTACGGDDANDQLIGAVCAVANDCDDDNDDTDPLECITTFKGGYCGKTGCAASSDCPEGSLCVTYEQANYCFLVCTDKSQCNQNRPVESESNCSSNVDPIEGGEEKVCVPPSADE